MTGLQRSLIPYLFLAPSALVLLLVVAVPIGYAVTLSFVQWDLLRPERGLQFAGLLNYAELIVSDVFREALVVTLIFVAGSLTLQMPLGLALALLVNREFHFKYTVQSLLLMPLMVMPVAVSMYWRHMLEPSTGVINHLLRLIGVPVQSWLSDLNWALVALVIVDTCRATPFVFILCLAGLQAIPRELPEAARVDGASALALLRHITLPLLAPVLLVALLLRLMDAIRVFDLIVALTLGGPGGATRTLIYLNYEIAFSYFQIGRAAALSVLIVLLITLLSVNLIRRMQREVMASRD